MRRLIAPVASLSLILGGGATVAVAAASPAAATGPYQLIPEYGAYPDNLTGSDLTQQQEHGADIWHHLCDTATTTPGNATSVIIANVDNGPGPPGSSTDGNWASALSYCNNDHVTTVGYVPTYFDTGKTLTGARFTLDDAKQMIDEWVSLYGNHLQGFFFDQVSTSDTPSNENYYATLADYARNRIRNSLVVYNPGISSDTTSWMISKGQANLVDVFESGLAAFQAWTPPAWVTQNPARVAATVYQDSPAPSVSQIAPKASQDASAACTTLQKDGLGYGVMWNYPPWTSDATNVEITGNGIWDDYRADGC